MYSTESNSTKLNICLLLSNYTLGNPARPEITEIYGNYLPLRGHKIIWISSVDSNLRKINREKFNDVEIYLIPHPSSHSLMKKMVSFIRYYTSQYLLVSKLVKNKNYDIIQVRNDIFSSLIVLFLKKKYNFPFVFQYSFPIETCKHNKVEKQYIHYFCKIQIFLQKYILKKADLVFPISKCMEMKLIKEGIPKSKMMPLPMGVNPKWLSFKENALNIKEKYNLRDYHVLLYIGTMDKLRSLEIIIYTMLKILKNEPKTKLLMVGDGNDRNNLEKLATKLEINKNIVFTGQIPYFDIPSFISISDVCLSPINPIDIYKVSSPTKLFEYMVMFKPIVANKEIPEQREVLEESNGGILTSFEMESFANGIMSLLDNKDLSKEMGKNGYNWVIKNRSYENMALDVEKRYLALLNKS